MNNVYIEFDGYCPECKLKGEQVEMRLNTMDFWESVKTGLQITIFPPYAAILQWRGEGKFKESKRTASGKYKGLLLTRTQGQNGKEIFPDENSVFEDSLDLEEYIHYIDKSYAEFEKNKFNVNDPIFEKQIIKLNVITKEQFDSLIKLFNETKSGKENSESFNAFHHSLYDLGVIFDFNWMRWDEGQSMLNNLQTDYSQLSLLQISMLLTLIFRADRFDDVSISLNFQNGNLNKIFERLVNIET